MRRGKTAPAAIAALGLVLVAVALIANQDWFDRHFLPSFFLPRRWYVDIFTVVRGLVIAAGLAVVFGAGRMAATITSRTPLRVFSIVTAALLAFGASELVLRRVHLRPTEWLLPEEEPRRQPDPRLGWTFVPARTARASVGDRTVDYTLDPAGYRVSRLDEPVDPERPTVVFAGESVMFGEGLAWEETVPAQVGAMMGVQSANLAVHGYSTDQAYLRLQTELPRFRHPIAVVTLFMTALFGRNLDDDRPHLGPGLVWQPAQPHARLVSLAGLLVPYRREATVERGISVTREVLRGVVNLAHERAAIPLIVTPQFGEDEPVEAMLRRRLMEEAKLPYVLVPIDSSWRIRWDRHPNARAAHAIALAVVSRLRRQEETRRGASSAEALRSAAHPQ